MVAPVTVLIREEKGVQEGVEVDRPPGVLDPGVVQPPAEVPARWPPRPRTPSREKVTIISVLLVLKIATVNPESVSVHWPPVRAEALPISSIMVVVKGRT